MSKNVTLPCIVILTLAGIAACDPTDMDDDPVTRPTYDRESPDRNDPEPVPEQDPDAGEPATEKPPAEDASDMP